MKAARFCLCVFVAFFGVASQSAAYTVTVDPTQRYQTFEGWGTSLAWMGKVIGNFPDPNRDAYMDLIFDPAKGLGLNVVRYNIGGGENPSDSFMAYRAAMDGFEPVAGQWNWDADAGQRWVLQQAMTRGANIVEAFSNSPPYWMTVSGSVTGATGGVDNLATAHQADFASYLATVTQHFHDAWGITFRTLEPFNEPVSNWWTYGGRQEGCHFSAGTDQTSIIQTLAFDLANANLTTAISAPDDNSIDETYSGLSKYDSTTLTDFAQINTHSYNGSNRALLYQSAALLSKRLWMSEYGDNDVTGITLSMRINKDMNTMHPAAWSYWQIVDNSSSWAMLYNAENGTDYTYTVNEKYWVYANFTKFIRPGSVIIGSNDSTYSLAAMDAGNGTLTLVTTNQGSAVQTVTYNLSKFYTSRAVVTAYQTSATEKLVSVPAGSIVNNQITFIVPGASVTTVVISGVTSQTPTTPLETWRLQYFGSTDNSGNGANTASPAKDGMPNLMKYALGLNPTIPTASPITVDVSSGQLRLTVPKNPNATDVSYSIQVTDDLTDPTSWTTTGTTVDQNTSSLLQAHDNTPIKQASKPRFMQLQVTMP